MSHTIQELKIRQALPLEAKIAMTKTRLREWVSFWGLDNVYVSFSGGKDSTVLLHIARSIYPDIKACFIDTGLEYPEIRDFVKSFDNVDIIKPKMTFKQVIEKYGYPFISKEVSECVYGAKKYLKSLEQAETIAKTDRQTDSTSTLISTINFAELANTLKRKMENREGGANERLLILLGELPPKTNKTEITPDKSLYNQEKYKFFLEAPFEISNRCCNVMKKAPAKEYAKKTGKKPIIAMLAEESNLRTQKWLKEGCNAFDNKNPTSNPLSFWTEQDILQYIRIYNVKICSVYGDIIPDYSNSDNIDGQIDISELGLIEDNRRLKLTGCNRTGCMFCGFGCHLEKSPNRFERMKITHPKQYDYIMRSKEKGGLNYKEVIDWINDNSDLNIRY